MAGCAICAISSSGWCASPCASGASGSASRRIWSIPCPFSCRSMAAAAKARATLARRADALRRAVLRPRLARRSGAAPARPFLAERRKTRMAREPVLDAPGPRRRVPLLRRADVFAGAAGARMPDRCRCATARRSRIMSKPSTLLLRDGRVEGCDVRDTMSGASFDVRAKTTLVAAGPWADIFLEHATQQAVVAQAAALQGHPCAGAVDDAQIRADHGDGGRAFLRAALARPHAARHHRHRVHGRSGQGRRRRSATSPTSSPSSTRICPTRELTPRQGRVSSMRGCDRWSMTARATPMAPAAARSSSITARTTASMDCSPPSAANGRRRAIWRDGRHWSKLGQRLRSTSHAGGDSRQKQRIDCRSPAHCTARAARHAAEPAGAADVGAGDIGRRSSRCARRWR